MGASHADDRYETTRQKSDTASATTNGLISHAELQEMLEEAIAAYGVPGAQVGVLAPASSQTSSSTPSQNSALVPVTAWAGVTNLSTGAPVIEDTLFQIGSITKIFTTTLAMQLVDEGRLSLDTRVKDVLPGFRVIGAPDVTDGCLIRHLMSHVSGIEGDAFPGNLGRGDDCVARYVDYIGTFPARTPLGGPLSYSNGAFVVLGHIIEVLRGVRWDDAVRTYLAEPAGLGHVWSLPEDILRFSAALGHERAVPTDQPVFPAPVAPAKTWHLPRCTGPCGQISASIGDLLDFAAIFLNGGVAPNGARLLSADSVEAMTTEQVSLRDQGIENVGWGLGWQLPNWGPERAFGHGGATIGQRANIVVFPDRRLVIATLTNADAGTQMAAHLAAELAGQAGIAAPPHPTPTDTPISEAESARFLGRYAREGEEFSFRRGGSTGVEAVIEPDDDDGPNGVQLTLPLHATAEGFYAVQRPDQRTPTEIAFLDAPRSPRAPFGVYAAMGHRVTPRVE